MSREKKTVREMTLIGVVLAFICVLSSLPMGINILGVAATLQIFVIAFAGFVLGAKKGALTATLYVIIGLILPVYSNMTSGPGILFGPTGGFLFGFIPLAFICGMTVKINHYLFKALLSICGVLVCHTIGLIQFVLVTDMDMMGSILAVTLPYLPKDITMTALAWMVARPVRRAIKYMDSSVKRS